MSLEGLLGSMSLQILRCRHSSIDIFYLQLLSIKCQKAWPFNDAKINIVFTASKHFLFLHPCILHLWTFGTPIRIAQWSHLSYRFLYGILIALIFLGFGGATSVWDSSVPLMHLLLHRSTEAISERKSKQLLWLPIWW